MTNRLCALPLALVTCLVLAAPIRGEARDDAGRLPWLGLRLGGVAAASATRSGAGGAGGGGAYALFDAKDFLADASLNLFVGDRTHVFAAG